MTNPINLKFLIDISNEYTFDAYKKHLSSSCALSYSQIHEIQSLQSFVNDISSEGVTIHKLDGFFFSYMIPQIGKEFDLLKMDEEKCLNIELKSKLIEEEKILEQLLKNKHYLNCLNKTLYLYTYIADSKICYRLVNDKLETCPFSDMIFTIMSMDDGYYKNIDDIFNVSNYLISPLSTPEKFIKNQYFLTQQQDNIKKSINQEARKNIDSYHFFSISGNAGTGKTLLLYDLGKTFSQKANTLIIHCGYLSDGHYEINSKIKNLTVISAKSLIQDFDLTPYHYILIDETHRIWKTQYSLIINHVKSNNKCCIFSLDHKQVLSKSEINNDIQNNIVRLDNLCKFKLTDKIRTNKEISLFVESIVNLNKKSIKKYENVTLLYAETKTIALELIKLFQDKNYIYINMTLSRYYPSSYSCYPLDRNTHKVIGQEFDNVIMVLDQSFYYNNNNILQAVQHPNPDYLYSQLFYQGITRVRNKLAIIIVSNKELFTKMLSVFDTNYD